MCPFHAIFKSYMPSQRYELTCPPKDFTMGTSVTSLLAYKVAQPTKWRFLRKNLSQLVIFGIGLVFT